MKVVIVVQAVDETGAALDIRGARLIDHATLAVAFAKEPTLGWYAEVSGLALGTYQLRVDVKHHPTLIFNGVLSDRNSARTFRFATPSPKCLTAARKQAKRGSSASPAVITLRLKLARKHQEVVLVAGWDYSGNSDNKLYAKSRRDDLYRGKTHQIRSAADITRDVPIRRAIFDHTRVTLFDFKSGVRTRWVKGQNGWHEIDNELQGAVATHVGPYKEPANQARRRNDDSLSIVHVYAYIKQLGATCPQSITAFHIFSHAWAGGPILVNTKQEAVYASGTLAAYRDPKDKDGRDKDFSTVNMHDVVAFKEAFASGAHVKIWGCLATTLYKDLIAAAMTARAAGKSRTEVLHFTADGTALHKSQEEIEEVFRTLIIPDSYMACFAKAIGMPVYGAPPGIGSNLADVGTKSYMYVDQTIHGRELRWLSGALGLVHDDSGHIRYE